MFDKKQKEFKDRMMDIEKKSLEAASKQVTEETKDRAVASEPSAGTNKEACLVGSRSPVN